MGSKKLTLLLILIGSLFWSLVMVRSGLGYDYGLGFWGPNGHDGIWHLAIIESLAKQSLAMPVFAGAMFSNYHIGFDLLVAVLHLVTTIPVRYLYFQILPPLFAFLVGVLSFIYVKNWKGAEAANFSLFFIYFGGSLGWLVSFIRNQNFYGESMFWSQQAVSTLVNPPFALSLVFLLLGLIFFQAFLKTKNKKASLGAIVCFSLLLSIKAYAGVLMLVSLFTFSVYTFLKEKNATNFIVFLCSLIFSLLLFLPLNSSSSGLIIFKPFWFLETMMGLSDRLGWQRYSEAMLAYKSGGMYLKFAAFYGIAFIVFLVGNLSTRMLGFLYFTRSSYKKWRMEKALGSLIVLGGILAPLLFLQQGTAWNTIQFFYYSQFFLAVFAGIFLAEITKNLAKSKSFAIFILVVCFTIPTSVATLKYHYLTKTPPAALPWEEYEALSFLSQQPNGVVLTYPYDPLLHDKFKAPKPLYVYVSSAYVSAFSQKPVFLEDEVNLTITGYDWEARRQLVGEWLKSQDHKYVYNFLREKNIAYIYWLKGQRAVLGEDQLGIEEIYTNSKVSVYKVK